MNRIVVKKYFNFIIGTLIVAVCFNLFFLSNDLAAFGVSGLSIITDKVFGIDPFIFILAANVVLIVISYFFLGKEYTQRTILGGVLFPIFVKLTAFIPNYIDISKADLLAIAIVGGALTGIGSGLVYKENFGTAGTDIVDELIHRYLKVPMGTAIILGDGIVVVSGGLVFGIEAMIYSLITLIMMSYICNKVTLGINRTKTFFIMTKREEKLKKYIMERFRSDITIIDSKGGYNKKSKNVLMVNIDTKHYYKLKNAIKRIDKTAFVSVTDSYGTYNKNISIKKEKSH